MSLPPDARHEVPSSPQELVAAAKDARGRCLKSNIINRVKSYVEFYSAFVAAYSAVVGDETLGKRFTELIDHTVDTIPGVQSGRVDREAAKQRYRFSPSWALYALAYMFETTSITEANEDVLWLLEKAAAPNTQAK